MNETPIQSMSTDELHRKLIANVDSTGGVLDTLQNALAAADEEGFYVESDESRATDIDAHLDRVMEYVDQEEPDPQKILGAAAAAREVASRFFRGLSLRLRDFQLPDHISAAADTLGEYAEYVVETVTHICEMASYWASIEGV
jgi:hypothetical protein